LLSLHQVFQMVNEVNGKLNAVSQLVTQLLTNRGTYPMLAHSLPAFSTGVLIDGGSPHYGNEGTPC
jgi:hypothetical protein